MESGDQAEFLSMLRGPLATRERALVPQRLELWMARGVGALGEWGRGATAAGAGDLLVGWMQLERRDAAAVPSLEEDSQALHQRLGDVARHDTSALITHAPASLAPSRWLALKDTLPMEEIWAGSWGEEESRQALALFEGLEEGILIRAALEKMGGQLDAMREDQVDECLFWACEHPEAFLPAHQAIRATTHLVNPDSPLARLSEMTPFYIHFTEAWAGWAALEGIARLVR
jgi:hypothetical protein